MDGVLYPEGLPVERRLEAYISRFRSVELNASYYRWPSDAAFASWRRRLPSDFLLTVKAPGALTHVKRLYSPSSGCSASKADSHYLDPNRGVPLVNSRRRQRLTSRASRIPRARPPPALESLRSSATRVGTPNRFSNFSERHGAAYCVMSGARLPCILRATAPSVYVRLHGPDAQSLYAGSYSDDDLRWWRDRIREWDGAGRDVFVYFNNDGEGNAVRNALTLTRLAAL